MYCMIHKAHKPVLVPARVHYVLYTLVFVVADKLGTGESDLLWYGGGTHILTVPALPQPRQPDTDTNIAVVQCFSFNLK